MELLIPVLLAVGILLLFLAKHLKSDKPVGTEPDPGADPATNAEEDAERPRDIYQVSAKVSDFYWNIAHPKDLLENSEAFAEGVAMLRTPENTIAALIDYVTGDNAIISCIAIEALRQRDDGPEAREAVLDCIGTIAEWPQYFGLLYLAKAFPSDQPVIGRVLLRTTGYLGDRLSRSFLAAFAKERLDDGETPSFQNISSSNTADAVPKLRRFLESLDPETRDPILTELDRWQGISVDKDFLKSSGRLWESSDARAADALVDHPALNEAVDLLEAGLVAARPQSSLVVGDRGVGKTTIQRKLAQRLFDNGWTVFVAGYSDLIAGQIYIGQFEERLKAVIEQLRGERRVVWFIPDFHTLAFAGRHRYSPVSALDVILPLVEQGHLKIVGETTPAALERLLRQIPRAVTSLSALRVDPLPPDAARTVAAEWLQRSATATDPTLLDQVWELTQQYLSDRAAPGNMIGLLDATLHRLRTGTADERPTVNLDDVVTTLASQTGLPTEILDHRQILDLDGLKKTLSERVIGQDEAVDCLVERVAMMKAGVTDPTRPVGVFLFAGPTGTGKTEIAKTLAEWLFGDPQRLLRLDMSELQSPDSLNRVFGQQEGEQNDSLAFQIRQQPFSVILLDEFEKAHPKVWDTFLQVFDDARITDRAGQTADFRHAIVILTSNLGATIPTGMSMGFGARGQEFDVHEVERAIEKAFRREFINRLDRVVVFRALSRDLMREILRKELRSAFQRRGVKNRAWAVEWDESAIEFLLDKGFTPDLGARPLKRAIERHLLSPLALTMVRHQVPEGDQFLFISSRDNQLDVSFVDPDAPALEPAGTTPDAPAVAATDLTPQSILLAPQGSAKELAALSRCLEKLEAIVEEETWQSAKSAAFTSMEDPDFWSSPSRFAALGRMEYRDRVAAGIRRARSLLQRLEGRSEDTHRQIPHHMVGILAQNLHLLEVGCHDIIEDRPREAFLMVELTSDRTQDGEEALSFARRLAGMYEGWINIRRMRMTQLESIDDPAGFRFRQVYAVAGYGAHSLLVPEHGLHIFEEPDTPPRQFRRVGVHVRVAAQADISPTNDPKVLLRQAETALRQDAVTDASIVRRYREEPSPLVRDAVRDWRTGRLDLVLAGNFDAF